ncbi:MAG: protein-L-isoaspartate(D-aspartate) O-methyltransferase [Pseudomonadota bacterium]
MTAAAVDPIAPEVRAEGMMKLIFAMRSNGVTDARVLDAVERTPREMFLDRAFQARAFEDIPLPIACGQTISQPSVVGMMTQALEVTPRCKVLEVGCGSGYQSAILARLARRVYAIERHRPLVRQARARTEALALANLSIMSGDGARGWPDQAPFDRILVTAAAEDPPALLLEQLRVGGIMVLPVGQSDEMQQLIRVIKTEAGLEYQELSEVRFVPLLPNIAPDVGD